MIPKDRPVVDAGAAYDRFASRYDSLLIENRINAYMRQTMMRLEETTFRGGGRLLELGCGTGDEALALAALGHEVVAIDASVEMVRAARKKADASPFGGRLTFLPGYARDLDRILQAEPPSSFDGAYSSFALSYEPDLRPVSRSVARLVRPGGPLLASIMNRLSLAEWGVAMASLHPALSGRRLRPVALHKVGTALTEVYPRSCDDVVEAFLPEFTLDQVRGLPVVLPPHYANRVLIGWPTLMRSLMRLDARLGGWTVLNRLGDHIVLSMRRTAHPDRR